MNERTRDALSVAFAILCLGYIGGGGAALLQRLAFPRGLYFVETLPTIYWLNWAVTLVGKAPGHLICGFLLGRLLRCLNPWHMFAALAVYMLLATAAMIWLSFEGTRLDALGLPIVVFMQVSHGVFGGFLIWGGILLGRKARLQRGERTR